MREDQKYCKNLPIYTPIVAPQRPGDTISRYVMKPVLVSADDLVFAIESHL